MSEYETTGSDIAKLVRKSARSTIHFAFSPGIDAKDSWLALNKRKNASHLHKVARREGPSQKVASGKMALDGREVVLTCQTEIPALARRFKYFLQENGMSFKVRVLDRNGVLIDTDLEKATTDEEEDEDIVEVDAEDDDDDDGVETDEIERDEDAEEAEEDDVETARLRQQYRSLAPLIARLGEGGDEEAAQAIGQLGDLFEKLADGGDADRAAKALTVLKRKLVGALRAGRAAPQGDAGARMSGG